MVKIFLLLCWNSVLIWGVQACCMNSTTAIEWDNEYKKWDCICWQLKSDGLFWWKDILFI